jgi:ADP-ribosyl-[dinitrogen reductase] hydrolase
MRCWPVALADWNHLEALMNDSMQQSRVTHAHPDCLSACALVNVMIYHLLRGVLPGTALSTGLESVSISTPFQEMITAAPQQARENLPNSGWVCHTVESAVWGLLTTSGFEDAVVQVVNLGNDADTAGAVVGALAGACYGLKGIPVSWRQRLRGQWPLNSGVFWSADDFVRLADSLVSLGMEKT